VKVRGEKEVREESREEERERDGERSERVSLSNVNKEGGGR